VTPDNRRLMRLPRGAEGHFFFRPRLAEILGSVMVGA
jgi:hypothetical protein